MAHFRCPEDEVRQIPAAGLVHFYDGHTGNLIVRKDLLQLGGNIKIRIRAADQRNLSLGQFVMEGGTGKGAAVRRNQQMGMMEVGRNHRNLPQLDGPLQQIAGFIVKHLLMVIVEMLPGIKIIGNHSAPPRDVGFLSY